MGFASARKTSGLTQAAAAKELGVGRSAIAMWECGQNMPRTARLPQIAKVYQCEIPDLLTLEGARAGEAGNLCEEDVDIQPPPQREQGV